MQNQKPTSTECLNALLTRFKGVIARRPINNEVEAEIVTSMRIWSVDCTLQGTPEELVANLFNLPLPQSKVDVRDIFQQDYAVGLYWFNPLTEADIVLTFEPSYTAEIRDHNGDGDDLMPWWYADAISDPDETQESCMHHAIDYFVWECRDALKDYIARCEAIEGYPTKEEFIKMLDDFGK
jgi:hypothetical protein